MVRAIKRGSVFFILFLIVLPSLHGLTLSGRYLGLILYKPGDTITTNYKISGTDMPTELTLSGNEELMKFISVSEVKGNEFDLTIAFPETLIPSGMYDFSLSVREVNPDPKPGLAALLAVNKRFNLQVYSHEKDIHVGLSASNVNVGTPVPFKIHIESQGYQDIESVRGVITVYDAKNKTLGSITTESKPLPALEFVTLDASFDTTGLPPADYWARAVVFYDGEEKEATNQFKIGNMDLMVRNYTSQLDPGFSEFNVILYNNWGNELRNVFFKLYLNGTELLHSSTITLAPWQEETVGGIVKIEQSPGKYNGLLHLFFEGEQKEQEIQLEIRSPPEPQQKNNSSIFTMMATSGIVVVLTGLVLLFMKRRIKKRGNNEF